jgi:hypothetical protein
MSTNTTDTPDAIDLLTGRDVNYNWVASFLLRGRVYTKRADGCTSFGDYGAKFPVFNSSGRRVMVTVRPEDRVEIMTRYLTDGREVPDAGHDPSL